MSGRNDPLLVSRIQSIDGLAVYRQASPTGGASVSATYVGPAGSGYDRAGDGGTALLVNHLVASAAGSRPHVELARELDRLGATLAHECAPESAEVTIWGPAPEWERLLALLSDVVQRPRFEAEDIARVRRQLRESQLREQTQPGSRAQRELMRSIFPVGHPYRESGLGTARSLARIDQRSLRRFHRDHYTADGAQLVITAPAAAAEIDRAARRSFRGFERERAPRSLELPPARPHSALKVIAMPGRSQVELRIGGPSLARSSPYHPALFLGQEVLGGRPLLSRLFQEVREKAGLAYHASSELEAMRLGGYWSAQAGTAPAHWRRALELITQEARRLGEEPIRLSELSMIRESAIGEITLALESTSEAHELAVEVAYHDLPRTYWRDWPSRLRAVRPHDIQSAVEQGFDASRAAAIAAGPIER